MMRSLSVLVALCLLVGGCATMPTESIDHVSLAAVEERAKCEIGEAFLYLKKNPQLPDLSLWSAGLTLTLSTDTTGGITPSTSLTGPFGRISPLELGLGASLNAKRTALLNVYISFVEAAKHKCSTTPQPLLEGHMGLAEWIIRVFEAQFLVEQKSDLQSVYNGEKSIGYNLEFLITVSASATPNFIIASTTGSKAAFAVEAKATHSADIAMVKLDESDFRERYKPVRKRTYVQIDNPALKDLPDSMRLLSNLPLKTKVRGPDKVVRQPDGFVTRLGPATKYKLDQVLQQLNNKILIQTLRR